MDICSALNYFLASSPSVNLKSTDKIQKNIVLIFHTANIRKVLTDQPESGGKHGLT